MIVEHIDDLCGEILRGVNRFFAPSWIETDWTHSDHEDPADGPAESLLVDHDDARGDARGDAGAVEQVRRQTDDCLECSLCGIRFLRIASFGVAPKQNTVKAKCHAPVPVL